MKFDDKLREAIIDWSSNIQDEWYLDNFIEENIRNISGSEAFSQISVAIDLLVNGENDNHFFEIIQVILALVRQSNTTEMPSNFHQLIDYMAAAFSNADLYDQAQMNEILKHYRIKGSLTDHLTLIKPQVENNTSAQQSDSPETMT